MKPEHRNLRPGVERKLQEYLSRRKEFEDFVALRHPLLASAFKAGQSGKTLEQWRNDIAQAYIKARQTGDYLKVQEFFRG